MPARRTVEGEMTKAEEDSNPGLPADQLSVLPLDHSGSRWRRRLQANVQVVGSFCRHHTRPSERWLDVEPKRAQRVALGLRWPSQEHILPLRPCGKTLDTISGILPPKEAFPFEEECRKPRFGVFPVGQPTHPSGSANTHTVGQPAHTQWDNRHIQWVNQHPPPQVGQPTHPVGQQHAPSGQPAYPQWVINTHPVGQETHPMSQLTYIRWVSQHTPSGSTRIRTVG